MAYLNESGLARYDGLIKNWVTFKSGTVDGIDPLLNWQKTDTAGAVTCYPLPAAPLEPVVNFLFTETPPVGEKSPTNPSTITGVSSVKVTRAGANILPIVGAGTTATGSTGGGTVSYLKNGDGTYSFTGTASSTGNTSGASSSRWDLLSLGFPEGTYSIGFVESYASVYLMLAITKNGATSYHGATGGSPYSFTIDGDTTQANVYFQVTNGTTYSETVTPYLAVGGNAGEGPRVSTDYTVNLGGTYYGGSLDLATGVMTVTHRLVEPDSLSYDISAHPANAGDFQYADTFGRTVTTDGTTLTITGEAGGQIVYNLATPETVSLTPTQIYSLSQVDAYTPRKNTVYSDQQSVQVGYPKSPQATATELTNAIISLGGNV